MLICGLDFETTGLSAENDFVTEIGAVLWDTELATPVSFYHKFCKVPVEVPPFITELTGITNELLEKYGCEQNEAFHGLDHFTSLSEIMVAQNAPFDKSFFDMGLARINVKKPNKQWLNTVTDVPYPKKIKSKGLTALAAEHGFLNPFPHRAVTDVLTMLTILSKYDINQCLGLQAEPKLNIWARITFNEKDKAKGAGFYYNGDKKQWYKQILEKDLETERNRCEQLGFTIEVIK